MLTFLGFGFFFNHLQVLISGTIVPSSSSVIPYKNSISFSSLTAHTSLQMESSEIDGGNDGERVGCTVGS